KPNGNLIIIDSPNFPCLPLCNYLFTKCYLTVTRNCGLSIMLYGTNCCHRNSSLFFINFQFINLFIMFIVNQWSNLVKNKSITTDTSILTNSLQKSDLSIFSAKRDSDIRRSLSE